MGIELTDKDVVNPDFYIVFTAEGAQQVYADVNNMPHDAYSDYIIKAIKLRSPIEFFDGKGYMCYVPSHTASIGVIVHTAKVFEKMQNDARYQMAMQQGQGRIRQ